MEEKEGLWWEKVSSQGSRSSSSMGLAPASIWRGSKGGFKAFSSYKNGGNEMKGKRRT